MTDFAKIKPIHTQRAACIYVRQSTPAQVEHNENPPLASTPWPTEPANWAGPASRWSSSMKTSACLGSSADQRSGFTRMTSEVALGHVGIVLGLEVSRLARNNADWYRLLELSGLTDTLIGDNDGVYHPALFNDRLLLGLNRPDTQSTSYSISH